MKKILISMLLILCLCACSGNKEPDPFQPLSKVTEAPEHSEAFEQAVSGKSADPAQNADSPVPADESPFEVEEDPFFTYDEPVEVPVIPPTATSVPTAIPLPTATPTPADPVLYTSGEDGYTYYEIQKGDTITCIARRFNLNLNQLMSLNGVSSETEVQPGMKIKLPKNGDPWSVYDGKRRVYNHPAMYTAKNGDTLFTVACIFGDVRPEDIASQNNMRLGTVLQGGEQVMVP